MVGLTVVLLSSLLIISVNEFASGSVDESANGAADGLSGLEEEVQAIVDNMENVSVYIDTSEGTVGVNESQVMSSASTIKVPILVEAIRQADQGDLIWEDDVLITAKDVVGGSGTIKNMEMPQTMTVRELAELMMVISDNTATNMTAQRVGFDQVNWTCAQLGCEETIMQNSIYTSMPQDRGPRNWSNAKEMVIITKGAHQSDLLTQEGKDEFARILRSANPARLTKLQDPEYHKDIVTGRKGGSTANPRVHHDVAMYTLGDKNVYASVFTESVEPAVAEEIEANVGKAIMDYMVENY